jgi:hypothetical protein
MPVWKLREIFRNKLKDLTVSSKNTTHTILNMPTYRQTRSLIEERKGAETKHRLRNEVRLDEIGAKPEQHSPSISFSRPAEKTEV